MLQEIWAAAPYLHNGSVPTLAGPLKPSSERVKKFKVGPACDIVNVGLTAEQLQSGSTLVTTDCSNLNSGSSNCGHEYVTKLTDQEKKALLEYLKALCLDVTSYCERRTTGAGSPFALCYASKSKTAVTSARRYFCATWLMAQT